jgi:hypothetical protein
MDPERNQKARHFVCQVGETALKLAAQFLAQTLVGVNAQNPFSAGLDIVQSPVELLGLVDKGMHQDARAVSLGDFHGSVRAE